MCKKGNGRNRKMRQYGHFVLRFLSVIALTLVHGQDSSSAGFINIDCGAPANTNYTNTQTGLAYISDSSFTETGINETVALVFGNAEVSQELWHLRSFPVGVRNCYHVNVSAGTKYLIRTIFYYGNYDNLNQLPVFDLHIGPNKWTTVNVSNVLNTYDTWEIIHVPQLNYLDICLVKTGSTKPFISVLELRPLSNDIYKTQSDLLSLVLFNRLDFGSSTNETVRYPNDAYDRLWIPDNIENCTEINTTLTIENLNKYQLPSTVMTSANIPSNSSDPLSLPIDTQGIDYPFYIYMHFAEIVNPQSNSNQSRLFNISLNGQHWYGDISPRYLNTTTVFTTAASLEQNYRFSFFKVGNSTLPPLINALEIYYAVAFHQLQTDQREVDAIKNIKSTYGIKKESWQGDPCVPTAYAWGGITCSDTDTAPPRIITLNLSSSELVGEIASVFGDLTLLETLDLSDNGLTGPVPDSLGHLQSLKTLNLARNNLTGAIPDYLYDKWKSGSLTLSIDGNPYLCNSTSCGMNPKKKNKTAIVVGSTLGGLFFVLIVASAIIYLPKKENQEEVESQTGWSRELLQEKRRQLSYSEVLNITNNFERTLGKGGFGTVYLGRLDDIEVAVKMLSPTSIQGYKEFHSEVKVLMRVHHKNLTSLVGYCDEGSQMGLIYEYMVNGDLKHHLSNNNPFILSWEMRLRIALEAAQGLEYLHNGCKPEIVHRDVKTSNILLNVKFQAKLSDFGVSKIFLAESSSNPVSTNVAGTPGYLDPEYYGTNWLTVTSDVYSFGVVLLEIITSKPVFSKTERTHISQWVNLRLENGDVKNIIDPRLHGDYCINSLWKVLELATNCLSISTIRPRMTEVVIELNECLAMEMARIRGGHTSNTSSGLMSLNMGSSGFSPLIR